MVRRHRLWLLLPAFPAIFADYLRTLLGQPQQYWAGDYSTLHEGQPILAYFLAIHPIAFIGFGVAWIAFVTLLMTTLPRTMAITLAFYLVLSHLWGLWTWGVSLPAAGLIMALVQLACGALLAVATTKVIVGDLALLSEESKNEPVPRSSLG
ncbi:MAG: hypothetical protein JWN70_4413 [Planctomycetaceae bacterium]|nr:hypothetical protein [Planctomycetaceae bacterium]